MPAPFDPQFLALLERLALLARRLGRARPPRRVFSARGAGAAGAFRDRRPYSAGDEQRTIDWAAYGRLGRLLVKLFEVEEPGEVFLLLDASASMAAGPGGPRKLACARRAAAAVAFLAAGRHERVGLALFSDRLLALAPPAGGRGVGRRILDFLERAPRPSGPSDPERAARDLVERRRRRGLAVAVTDALWPGDPARPRLALRAGGLEAAILHVIEPLDRAPPFEGDLLLRDAETGRERKATIDAGAIERHARAFDAHAEAVAAACARQGAAYVALRTDRDLEEALLELLRAEKI
jgi:uncharacterized protein (DUF58 family)